MIEIINKIFIVESSWLFILLYQQCAVTQISNTFCLLRKCTLTIFYYNFQISNKMYSRQYKQNKKIQTKTNRHLYFSPLQSISNTRVMLAGSSFEYHTTSLFVNKQLNHVFFCKLITPARHIPHASR